MKQKGTWVEVAMWQTDVGGSGGAGDFGKQHFFPKKCRDDISNSVLILKLKRR